MILVFGGTTEGRIVAELLSSIDLPFYYSTKLESQPDVPGTRIFGIMDADLIARFCKTNGIRLIVDAAHPFATSLHNNIAKAAQELSLVTLRFERTSPTTSGYQHIRRFKDYSSIVESVEISGYSTILALTGVQTIERFRPLWINTKCFFRILNTKQSLSAAAKSGIPLNQVVQDSNTESLESLLGLIARTNAEVIITKDSGYSGGLDVKIAASQHAGIPLWIIEKPILPCFSFTENNRKDLLKRLLLLKKELLATNRLRTGFTTGTCVCAAAKASVIALEEGRFPDYVSVYTKDGTEAKFAVFPKQLSDTEASCTVIKDSGDDPDVTHAKEIGCSIAYSASNDVVFCRGVGVGLVTLDGLQVAVGEPAINPEPRRMIRKLLFDMQQHYCIDKGFVATPFVPNGEVIAQKTFNSRVGILGGISILGTTGRIYPYSAEAFLAAIREQIRVAKSLGVSEIVATSGKRSENTLKSIGFMQPPQAYIHFGNFVGEAVSIASQEGLASVVVGIMLGKAAKLAEGYVDTHSREVTFNPSFLADLALSIGYSSAISSQIRDLKLANALTSIVPFSASEPLYIELAQKCKDVCLSYCSSSVKVTLALIVGENMPLVAE